MADNPVRDKSYAFALRIINMCQHLSKEKKEYVLSKQMLRAGTSAGANIEEAMGGHSRKEFASKVSISYKEARETHYWLRLPRDSGYMHKSIADPAIKDCEELLPMIGSAQKTLKNAPPVKAA